MARRPFIAGNWKMNMTPSQAKELVKDLIPLVKDAQCEVVICPPYIDLPVVSEMIKDTNIKLGAQNVHWTDKGAFTDEVAADMLKEYGVEYVIIGHSERRQYFGETDETVNKRAKKALEAGLKPIICVGETLEQREANITNEIVTAQINGDLAGFSAEELLNCVIAYEPIWAIGTGKTATKEDANDTIAVIRNAVAKLFDEDTASKLRIQYGGSMKPSNAHDLMSMPEIDGGLIGGASLKAADFAGVVNY